AQTPDIYTQSRPPIEASPKTKQSWAFLSPAQRKQAMEQEAGLIQDPKPQMLSDAEVAQQGFPKGTKAYRDKDGIVKTTYTPPASQQNGGKALPANVVTKLTKQAGIYDNTETLLGSFNNKYAGNTVGGSAENLIGQLGGERIGLATPGQADWWQQYDRQKNEVRNALFGSALTPSEQAAFERADIRPNMAPDKIRANLRMQSKIVSAGLARQSKVWKAQGYNTEAIDAATLPTNAQQQPATGGFRILPD
ncbi:MAG: hypothetical protein M3R16_12450, partial [Pseudomonadota bacterium]|nr:hypothetical protein [Pseudomonadota bacterium]